MPHCLNLSVVLRYDFIITYLAVMFFIYWIRAIFQLKRLNYVFWRVWESRNRQIHRSRRSQQGKNPSMNNGK